MNNNDNYKIFDDSRPGSNVTMPLYIELPRMQKNANKILNYGNNAKFEEESFDRIEKTLVANASTSKRNSDIDFNCYSQYNTSSQGKVIKTCSNYINQIEEMHKPEVCLNCGKKCLGIQDSYCSNCSLYLLRSEINYYEADTQGAKRKHHWINFLNSVNTQSLDNLKPDQTKEILEIEYDYLSERKIHKSGNKINHQQSFSKSIQTFGHYQNSNVKVKNLPTYQASSQKKSYCEKYPEEKRWKPEDFYSLNQDASSITCKIEEEQDQKANIKTLFYETNNQVNNQIKVKSFQTELIDLEQERLLPDHSKILSQSQNLFKINKADAAPSNSTLLVCTDSKVNINTEQNFKENECEWFPSNQKNAQGKKIEIIELSDSEDLSIKNDDFGEIGTPKKKLYELFSKDRDSIKDNKIQNHKGVVENLISIFMENKNKKSTLSQYESTSIDPKIDLTSNTNIQKDNTLILRDIINNIEYNDLKNPETQQELQGNNLQKDNKSQLFDIKLIDSENFSKEFPTNIEIKIPNDELPIVVSEKNSYNKRTRGSRKSEKGTEIKASVIKPRKPRLQRLSNQTKQSKEKILETCSEDSKSEASEYFILDENYDIILECYFDESDFVDIFEVRKKMNEFEIIGENIKSIPNIDEIVYPTKPEVNIGENYQAQIPQLNSFSSSKRGLCQIWDPDKIPEESFKEYAKKLSNLTKISQQNINEEKATQTLVDQNYNIDKALTFCQQNLEYIKRLLQTK